ncbi:MAG: hypothetical protein IPK57_14440 [Chitinophagaceae bacterium]|nr:hypothetical protein [Chitinophagaceae bacterium]
MADKMSRQQFLQYTSSAGAAVLLSSLEGFALEKREKKLKVAIIGCGSVSNRYIPHPANILLIDCKPM